MGSCCSTNCVVLPNSLVTAAENGDLRTVKRLVEKDGISLDYVQDEPGSRTALLACAYNGHFDVAKYLIRLEADVNKAGRSGETPLIVCSHRGHHEIVKLLLHKGADPHQTNPHCGWNALHRAASAGDFKSASLLVDAGCDYNVQDDTRGTNALMRACRGGHVDTVRFLLSLPNIQLNQFSHRGRHALYFCKLSPECFELVLEALKEDRDKVFQELQNAGTNLIVDVMGIVMKYHTVDLKLAQQQFQDGTYDFSLSKN